MGGYAGERKSLDTRESVHANEYAETKSEILDGNIAYYASGVADWVSPLYAMKAIGPSGGNYLPYHYGCYMWHRTA